MVRVECKDRGVPALRPLKGHLCATCHTTRWQRRAPLLNERQRPGRGGSQEFGPWQNCDQQKTGGTPPNCMNAHHRGTVTMAAIVLEITSVETAGPES